MNCDCVPFALSDNADCESTAQYNSVNSLRRASEIPSRISWRLEALSRPKPKKLRIPSQSLNQDFIH